MMQIPMERLYRPTFQQCRSMADKSRQFLIDLDGRRYMMSRQQAVKIVGSVVFRQLLTANLINETSGRIWVTNRGRAEVYGDEAERIADLRREIDDLKSDIEGMSPHAVDELDRSELRAMDDDLWAMKGELRSRIKRARQAPPVIIREAASE